MPEGDTQKGDQFTIFRVREKVFDPDTGRLLGHHVDILGWVEIEQPNPESSLATIRESFGEIEVGDRLMPREPLPEEIAIPASPGDVDGRISFFANKRTVMGTADFVYLNRGALQGLEVGSPLEVYRQSFLAKEATRDERVRVPERVVAQLLVVKADPNTAVAFVAHTEHGARARRSLPRRAGVAGRPRASYPGSSPVPGSSRLVSRPPCSTPRIPRTRSPCDPGSPCSSALCFRPGLAAALLHEHGDPERALRASGLAPARSGDARGGARDPAPRARGGAAAALARVSAAPRATRGSRPAPARAGRRGGARRARHRDRGIARAHAARPRAGARVRRRARARRPRRDLGPRARHRRGGARGRARCRRAHHRGAGLRSGSRVSGGAPPAREPHRRRRARW